MFRNELTRLWRAYPDNQQVIHMRTREAAGSSGDEDVRSGRVSLEVLNSVLEREPRSLIYACGPVMSVWEKRAHAAKGTTPPPLFLETMPSYLSA
jgi:3-ketosteroid 9alpha-monooxygenase subunit B